MRTHQEIDARSLAMHRLVAEKIRANPDLFQKAQATLARWRHTVCPSSQPYLQEWERLMHQGPDACLAIALEESEHADALRQSSPFAAILSHQERFTFLKAWSREHAAQ